MTPEAQRIAIAETCGWKTSQRTSKGFGSGDYIDRGWEKDGLFFRRLPDFPNDLNAMHEAEQKLSCQQQQNYTGQLADICGVYIDHDIGGWGDFCAFDVIHATASQRAEALLRTTGKWDDSK